MHIPLQTKNYTHIRRDRVGWTGYIGRDLGALSIVIARKPGKERERGRRWKRISGVITFLVRSQQGKKSEKLYSLNF